MSVKHKLYFRIEGCNGSTVSGTVKAKTYKKALAKAEKKAEAVIGNRAWQIKIEVLE